MVPLSSAWAHSRRLAALSTVTVILLLAAFTLGVAGPGPRPSALPHGDGGVDGLVGLAAEAGIPAILYGTAWKEEATAELVAEALAVGFRGIDTANQPAHYREDLVGDGIRQFVAQGGAREEVFVQTKFSPYQETAELGERERPYDAGALVEDQVRQSVASSLEHLGLTYLDSLVLHSPLKTVEETARAWGAMEEFVSAGSVRQLGVSNIYDLESLQALHSQAKVKPSVVQNRFYSQSCFDVDIRRWCKDNAVLYQSFWTLTANLDALATEPVLQIAQERRLTPAQVWFLFVMAEGIVPLTGTTNLTHMEQDLALVAEAPLEDSQREAIWQVIQDGTGCLEVPLI